MKEKLDELRTALTKAAREVGVELEIGSMTYGNARVTFSCKGFTEGGKYEQFCRDAPRKGVPTSWYAKEFYDNDAKDFLKIVGVLSRGRKNVVALESIETGKSYKGSVAYVKKWLKE